MPYALLEDDPLWYKDAIIYELHIKAFADSNADGTGDLRGLIDKLDYLEELGINALWLLPFFPSPLRDDGYDIADYSSVHPDYGTTRDFRRLLREAHRRGIRVIIELVMNHTSSDHLWFQRSRTARPGSRWHNMYVWSDTPDKYSDARIIFNDFETSNWQWDPAAKSYYWHRFYSHQPDLNFDSPHVHSEMLKVIDFWLGMGVDGVRLDAVPYLYEREGTNCENLPETHRFLKKLTAHVTSKFKNKMLLAEANQWPEDAAAYFGSGDECHMAFHFPLMPRMFMAFQMEDSFPIIDILNSTPQIPEHCQWAIFLRNHDELTLEMVTDEERDYMYRSYAQDPRAKINLGIRRRLAPLLSNNRRKIELMNILLFSFPGTPVIYYGDEIGMGDNYYLGDRNGVRTPMQWSPDRNAGFSDANPHSLYYPVIIDPDYHYESINVETQERNLSSLLWWMKRVIAVRKRFKAFSRGDFVIIHSDNPKIMVFVRSYGVEIILVAVNLSRFAQMVELDLSRYAGYIPEETFSGNRFPVIKDSPYPLTFGPYNHYWLLLREPASLKGDRDQIPKITLRGGWKTLFEKRHRQKCELLLPQYLIRCRWFASKSRTIRAVRINESIRIPCKNEPAQLLLIEVRYNEGAPELYMLPVSFAPEPDAAHIYEEHPGSCIMPLRAAGTDGILYESILNDEFRNIMLSSMARKAKIKGDSGELAFDSRPPLKKLLKKEIDGLSSRPLSADQSNSSIIYGERYFLKLYRKLDAGIHPDREITQHLTEHRLYENIPAYAGAIEYQRSRRPPITVGMLQHYVESMGDAWALTVDFANRYFDRILIKKEELEPPKTGASFLAGIGEADVPELLRDLIGTPFMETAALLGRRTAELHCALSTAAGNDNFKHERFSMLYQRSVFQSMQSLAKRTIGTLKKNIGSLPEDAQADARGVIDAEQSIIEALRSILQKKIDASKIRIHGDYHLGQVLYTGKDFIIIDFEGEPARSISERRLKQTPFKDIAGMIRSFHYAAHAPLFQLKTVRPEDIALLQPWIEPWYYCVSGLFTGAYIEVAESRAFMPREHIERRILMQTYLLEKAVYELSYEMNNRPDWIIIPLKGIISTLSGSNTNQ